MKQLFHILLLVSLLLCVDLSSNHSFAQTKTSNPNVGAGDGLFYGNTFATNNLRCAGVGIIGEMKVTAVVVDCVKNGVLTAIRNFGAQFVPYYNRILFTMLFLSVALFGLQMMFDRDHISQRINMVPRIMKFVLKIALVLYFSQVLSGALAGQIDWPFHIMGAIGDMAGWVTAPIFAAAATPGGIACQPDFTAPGLTALGLPTTLTSPEYAVWNLMDCMFARVVGVGAGLTLKFGLVGFFTAALFSGTFGVMIFMAGFTMIMQLLMTIVKAVYYVLSAYILIGILLILSPLFISLLLFQSTTVFFNKWLDMLTSAIMQPVLIFAVLSMFLLTVQLAIFGSDINGTFAAAPSAAVAYPPSADPRFDSIPSLARQLGTDFKTKWDFISTYKKEKPLFSWKIPSDPKFYEALGIPAGKFVGATAALLNKFLDKALDLNFIYLPFIDWGANTQQNFRSLFVSLVVLVLLLDLLLSFMAKVPLLSAAMMSSSSNVRSVMGYAPGETAVHGAVGGIEAGLGAAVAGKGGGLGAAGSLLTRGIPSAVMGGISGGVRAAIKGTPHA